MKFEIDDMVKIIDKKNYHFGNYGWIEEIDGKNIIVEVALEGGVFRSTFQSKQLKLLKKPTDGGY